MLRSRPVCRSLSEPDGSERQAACHQRCSDPRQSRSLGGISRWRSARRSRFFGCKAIPCRRSGAGSVDPPRRSPVSCGATQPPAAAGWSIVRRPPSGMPSDRPVARNRPSLRSTRLCAPMWRRDWPASSSLPSGVPVPGPAVSWKGRRHGPRQDRRWARAWSPEQIARRLPVDFPDDETMRISHEAIYQALFVQGRGALRRELTACLRTGRALRVPRARVRSAARALSRPRS